MEYKETACKVGGIPNNAIPNVDENVQRLLDIAVKMRETQSSIAERVHQLGGCEQLIYEVEPQFGNRAIFINSLVDYFGEIEYNYKYINEKMKEI